MANEGIDNNAKVLNGEGLPFNSSLIQSDDCCLLNPTVENPDIVQPPDAVDAGISTDVAHANVQEEAGAVASKREQKKCAMTLATAAAFLAVVVDLGVGLGTKNGNKSVSLSNNAVTLEECLKEDKALKESTIVPTWMPTSSLTSYLLTAVSLSKETGEEEDSTAATISGAPEDYSNDFMGTMMDVQNISDGMVQRDLRGSSSVASKVCQLKASSKSRVRTINNIVMINPFVFLPCSMVTHKLFYISIPTNCCVTEIAVR